MNDPAKAQLEALAHRGIEAVRRGDADTARQAFAAITASGRASPQIWLFLAQACDIADDRPAARAALAQVLQLDPGNPYALVMQGELFTRDGDDRAAVNWYDHALSATAGGGTWASAKNPARQAPANMNVTNTGTHSIALQKAARLAASSDSATR